jgi:hypothetical protein
MLRIKAAKNNTINYVCDCGVVGKCMIKPLVDNSVIVVIINCAGCGEPERVVIRQDDELDKECDLSWALTLSNKIIGEI